MPPSVGWRDKCHVLYVLRETRTGVNQGLIVASPHAQVRRHGGLQGCSCVCKRQSILRGRSAILARNPITCRHLYLSLVMTADLPCLYRIAASARNTVSLPPCAAVDRGSLAISDSYLCRLAPKVLASPDLRPAPKFHTASKSPMGVRRFWKKDWLTASTSPRNE